VALVLIVCFIVVIIVIYFVIKNKKSATKKGDDLDLTSHKNLDYHSLGSENSSQSLSTAQQNTTSVVIPDTEDLILEKEIGSGNFGAVYMGTWKSIPVALKILTDPSKNEELQKEIAILSKFDHPNIVKYYGIGYINRKEFIILEFVNGLDLLNYLLQMFEQSISFPVDTKLQLICQIARGMQTLHKNDVLHRDLAARNVLLHIEQEDGASKITAKLTDFGLSRSTEKNYYLIENSRTVPLRWTAPEVFKTSRFYKQSDVWSFGVVCWEICSNGDRPYLALSNTDVIDYVAEEGKILDRPSIDCSDDLWELMKKCFLFNYQERPSFADLVEILEKDKITNITITEDYIKLTEGNYLMTPKRSANKEEKIEETNQPRNSKSQIDSYSTYQSKDV